MYLNSYRTPSGTVPVFRYITLAGTLTSRGLNHDRRALEIEHIFRNSPAVTPEFGANAVLWLGRELTAVERARIDPNHSTVYTTWTDTIRPLPQDIRNNLAASMTDVDPEYNALNELVSSGSAAAVDVVLRRLGATGNDSDRESLEVASVLDTENTNAAALQAVDDAINAQAAGAPIAPLSNILGPVSAVDTSTLNSVATTESRATSSNNSSNSSSSSSSHTSSSSYSSDIEKFIDDELADEDISDEDFDTLRQVLSEMTTNERQSVYRDIRDAKALDDDPAGTNVRTLFGRALVSNSAFARFLAQTGDPHLRVRIHHLLNDVASSSSSSPSSVPPNSPPGSPSDLKQVLVPPRMVSPNLDDPEQWSQSSVEDNLPNSVGPPDNESVALSDTTFPPTPAPTPALSDTTFPPTPTAGSGGGPGGAGGAGGTGGVAGTTTATIVPGAAKPPYTGKGAIYHREAITVFFNDADHPVWDEELNANIDKAKYSQKDANDVIKNLVFTQGPKFLVARPKTNGDIQELKEIIQLWSSVQRSMSRGPRIPSVGISLGALLGSIGGAAPWAPTSGSAVTGGAMAVSPPSIPPSTSVPPSSGPATIVNLAKAWDNKSYGLGGAGHSHGPSTTAETFKVKEQTKIRMYQEAGPGLNEPFPRGVMVLPVASAFEQSSRIDHIC